MINKKYLHLLQRNILAYSQKRRDVIKTAGDALHLSKKTIFALHRDDLKQAKESLCEAKGLLLSLQKKYKKEPKIFAEGSYKAGVEEFVEASIFYSFLKGEKIDKLTGIEIDPDIFINGLCDVPGELYRYAIKSATERKFDMAKKCHKAAENVIGELIYMNLTGYARQKFDQAKSAMHKLEQIMYEVSMKKE